MDYKFILILAICLILYYIYHELEKVKVQVEELSEKVDKQKITKKQSSTVNNLTKKVNIPAVNLPSVNNNLSGVNTNNLTGVNTNNLSRVNTTNLERVNTNNFSSLNTNKKSVTIRSPNKSSNVISTKTKLNKLDNSDNIILIDDDLTVDSSRKEEINISETESPESYENNSNDLALYSNDNNETSITVDDIIEKNEEIQIDTKINTIVENINEDNSNEENEFCKESDNINIIENNNDSSENLLLDDSNEASSSSTELKKKNQKSLDEMNEIPIITDSLNQILSTKKEIICTDTSDKNETSEEDEEIDVNIDIDEIVNESSNNKFKMKTLKRKKLADLQKIASEYGISLNKVKEGKLKNKTKTELCKEIVSKQY